MGNQSGEAKRGANRGADCVVVCFSSQSASVGQHRFVIAQRLGIPDSAAPDNYVGVSATSNSWSGTVKIAVANAEDAVRRTRGSFAARFVLACTLPSDSRDWFVHPRRTSIHGHHIRNMT